MSAESVAYDLNMASDMLRRVAIKRACASFMPQMGLVRQMMRRLLRFGFGALQSTPAPAMTRPEGAEFQQDDIPKQLHNAIGWWR